MDTLRSLLRLLTFRAERAELAGLSGRHLALGLAATWLVGMGRWWEDPGAGLLQRLGLGSLVYVLVLACLLWLVLLPLAGRSWSFLNVLTFVTLTSPPGLLYALPVRSWLELDAARQARLWFLAIVALWRMLLWVRYLYVGAGLSGLATFAAALLPLTFVVFVLSALNLERAVFDLMGGIRPGEGTVNDAAYAALTGISMLSVLFFIPLLLIYLVVALRGPKLREGKEPRASEI
jgi:hypothetical protein